MLKLSNESIFMSSNEKDDSAPLNHSWLIFLLCEMHLKIFGVWHHRFNPSKSVVYRMSIITIESWRAKYTALIKMDGWKIYRKNSTSSVFRLLYLTDNLSEDSNHIYTSKYFWNKLIYIHKLIYIYILDYENNLCLFTLY